MIIYSESSHVEHGIEQEWIQWAKDVLIPAMYGTGKFTKAVFTKVTSHSDDTGNTYSIQYYTNSKKELNEFYQHHSADIAQLIVTKFGTKVLSFKTELDLIEIFEF